MTEPNKYTLCELIDLIVLDSRICTNSKFTNYVNELSERLDLSFSSTILFCNIFYRSCRGDFPQKNEILQVISGESTKGIYLSIQELFKKEYVKSFRTHPRRPYLCFYTLEELDRKIINDELPSINKKNSGETILKVVIKPISNSNDFIIYLKDAEIGIIYFNLSEINNYTAVLKNNLVSEGNSLDEIENKINKMLKEKEISLD